MEKQSNLRVITFGDVWHIFVSRIWVILLAVVLVLGGFILFDKLTYSERYEATATLYILKQNDQTNQQQNSQSEDFSLALSVINDCDTLLRSHAVLDEVITKLKLDISYEDLYDSITISNPEETRILQVTVEADSAQAAVSIVNKICEIGPEKINKVMVIEPVRNFENGITDGKPCNKTSLFVYILVGLVVAVATYAIFLLTFLFDDRLKTDEEIERNLELTVIGDIPNADEHKNHRYGYYRYYGKKYKKYGYGNMPYGETAEQAASSEGLSETEETLSKKDKKKNKKVKNKESEEK